MQVRPCACHYPIDLPVIYMHIYISVSISKTGAKELFSYLISFRNYEIGTKTTHCAKAPLSPVNKEGVRK